MSEGKKGNPVVAEVAGAAIGSAVELVGGKGWGKAAEVTAKLIVEHAPETAMEIGKAAVSGAGFATVSGSLLAAGAGVIGFGAAALIAVPAALVGLGFMMALGEGGGGGSSGGFNPP